LPLLKNGEASERAEAQSFWNEFFQIVNIHRRRVASFEATDYFSGLKDEELPRFILVSDPHGTRLSDR
jgi:hypothetical protein